MKKKINYFRIVWLFGLVSTLLLILLLIMKFKIGYQYKLNYLYFYNCSNSLCVSSDKGAVTGNIYSSYLCSDTCPTIKGVIDNKDGYIILSDNTLYNYISGVVVASDYDSYTYLDNYFIVEKDNKYGLMDLNSKILIPVSYEILISYDNSSFVGKTEEGYVLVSENNEPILNNTYDYLYAYNDIVIVVEDMFLDIIDLEGYSLIPEKIEVYNSDNYLTVSNSDNVLTLKISKEEGNIVYTFNLDTKEIIEL